VAHNVVFAARIWLNISLFYINCSNCRSHLKNSRDRDADDTIKVAGFQSV